MNEFEKSLKSEGIRQLAGPTDVDMNRGERGLGARTGNFVGSRVLPKVDYTLEFIDAPPVFWQVRDLHLCEALSEPYTLTLEIVTADLDADTDVLLGASAELRISRDILVHPICGIVHQVELIGIAFDRLRIRVTIAPALHLLGQRVDTRVWQNATVPEVLHEVLEPTLRDYGRSVELAGLQATYRPREYIVQYRESDLAFIHRLMEEEGITYWFDHASGKGKEVLVLEDSNDNYQEIETIDEDPQLRIIQNHDTADVESLHEFVWSRELTSTLIHQRIYDWLDPHTRVLALAPPSGGHADERGRTREVYHHGHFVESDPQPRTIRKLTAVRQKDRIARGRGNVIGLVSGRRFTLVDHERAELTQQYLVRRSVHVGDCPEVIQGEVSTANPRYENHFECMIFNADDPFRPPQVTPRPRIYGPQTAIVTGPAGEEIHTDEHGRVKVLFGWDRMHAANDDTSMWIRVAHHWAGPGFGTFFVPRIGMEVVVEFIEGDPAKPLINGCVYNGANAISVGVPNNKTQSTIRTKSSPDSDGYNELRFEDAAASEEIFLHAQKDLNETIEHDHSTTVHNSQTVTVDVDQTTTVSGNQTNSVSGNQTETISGDATLTVEKNRTITIKGSQAITIEGSLSNSEVNGSKLGITGDYKIDASNSIEVQAPTHILLTCAGSSIKLEPGKITLTAGDGASLTLDASALMVSSKGSHVLLETTALAAASGGGAVLLDDTALMTSSDGSQVFLDANATLSSPGEAHVAAPISKLYADGGVVEANAAGIAVGGGKVDISADGVAAIMGSKVKLN
jgi:type VI secretion system secreted protein VgrG